MKSSLLTVMLLLGVVSIEAVQIDSTAKNSVPHHSMVTIDLQQTEYKPNRLVQIEEAPIDESYFVQYHE